MTGPHHQQTEADRIAREAEQPKRRESTLTFVSTDTDFMCRLIDWAAKETPANGHTYLIRDNCDPTPEAIAGLIAAAEAVVGDHKRLCSTCQKCSHNVCINKLSAALKAVKDAK